MAAKTFREWWDENYPNVSTIDEICEEAWNAATDAAEERFASTNGTMVPCLDVRAIVNRCTLGPSEKIERLRELLAQHQ